MSRVDAAAASDRLPWLSDEPKRAPRAARRPAAVPLAWATAIILLVAGAGFWVGFDTADQIVTPPSARHPQPATTVRLPEPRAAAPEVRLPAQSEVRPAPLSEMRTLRPREVPIAAPPAHRHAMAETKARPAAAESSPVSEARPAPAPPATAPVAVRPTQAFVPPQPWNPRIAQGAAGRVVQVGAFGSVHQAKRGWWHMVRAYPAMSRLPAVVRPSRNSRGRLFYRFQVGTTSQAHSEILCQRMSRIGFSCAIVGLPWKAKVER